MEDENVKKGIIFAEQVWWSLAKRIVFLAGKMYDWDETQWQDANEKFLRPTDYRVVMD